VTPGSSVCGSTLASADDPGSDGEPAPPADDPGADPVAPAVGAPLDAGPAQAATTRATRTPTNMLALNW